MKIGKIKDKVAAKVAKGKAKVAAKCGKAKKACAAILMMAALCTVMCGCRMGEQPTAQRAQTSTIRDNVITVTVVMPTNAVAEIAEKPAIHVEVGNLAQANETSGTETMSNAPKNTPTVTTDTDTALDIPVNKANSGTSAAGGAAEKLLGAGADWVAGKVNNAVAVPQNKSGGESLQGNAVCPGNACTDREVK